MCIFLVSFERIRTHLIAIDTNVKCECTRMHECRQMRMEYTNGFKYHRSSNKSVLPIDNIVFVLVFVLILTLMSKSVPFES